MPYSEFSKVFTNLEMCHLIPECWNFESKLKHRLPWKSVEAHRQWRCGYNAGGGLNSRPTRSYNKITNEQFSTLKVASTGVRADRDIVRFFTLPAGTYVIVPVTTQPGIEGKFYLRVFSDDREIVVRELDDPDTASFIQAEQLLDAETVYVLIRRFMLFCNKYDEIDGYGLRQILSFKPQNGTSHLLC